MPRFGKSEGWPAVPDGGRLERQEPARAASFVADVGVPLAQAAVSGGIVSGLLTWAVLELGADVDAARFLLFWWLVFGGVAWFVVLIDGRRLLWRLERWIGRDLDGDDVAGAPERLVLVGERQSREDARKQAVGAQRSEFRRFVAALPARGTAERRWLRVVGADAYRQYRDVLMRLGMAEWRSVRPDGKPNERQGWRLVVPVSDVLAKIDDD